MFDDRSTTARVAQCAAITIGIGQFRSDARNYVHRARAGETFRVLRRGRPVAELRATRHDPFDDTARISLAVARTQPGLLDRVAAGEVIAIESGGEVIVAFHPCAGSDAFHLGRVSQARPHRSS
jgi:antitoxin (DNA-binding transcriptional repressor) of toxin-antitoxin stability system